MDLAGARRVMEGEAIELPSFVDGDVIVFSDGRAGHVNQSLGLAAALGIEDPEVLQIRTKRSGKLGEWLAKRLPVGMGYDATVWKALLKPNGPRAIIGTGWQVSRVVRYLKKQRPELFAIQLMRPSGKAEEYDVVALPRHDARGYWAKAHQNTIQTIGMINRVNHEILRREWDRWKSRLQSCHSPRLAVLIGGPSKHGKVDDDDFVKLAESALAWAKANGGSLLVTASRRTPVTARKTISDMLNKQRVVPVNYWAPDEASRDNPYFAYLAGCDGALVTVDSMAMLSEVATAGKPLYIWGDVSKMPEKFKEYVQLLKRQNRAANWEARLSLRLPGQGLLDGPMVAGFVRARYAKTMKKD